MATIYRRLSWDLYLEANSRLWSKYLEVERQALAMKGPK